MKGYGYNQSRRTQHEPYRHPSQPKVTKNPELIHTYWGLFDKFMDQIAKEPPQEGETK